MEIKEIFAKPAPTRRKKRLFSACKQHFLKMQPVVDRLKAVGWLKKCKCYVTIMAKIKHC